MKNNSQCLKIGKTFFLLQQNLRNFNQNLPNKIKSINLLKSTFNHSLFKAKSHSKIRNSFGINPNQNKPQPKYIVNAPTNLIKKN
jgi:hypothetical protein